MAKERQKKDNHNLSEFLLQLKCDFFLSIFAIEASFMLQTVTLFLFSHVPVL